MSDGVYQENLILGAEGSLEPDLDVCILYTSSTFKFSRYRKRFLSIYHILSIILSTHCICTNHAPFP